MVASSCKIKIVDHIVRPRQALSDHPQFCPHIIRQQSHIVSSANCFDNIALWTLTVHSWCNSLCLDWASDHVTDYALAKLHLPNCLQFISFPFDDALFLLLVLFFSCYVFPSCSFRSSRSSSRFSVYLLFVFGVKSAHRRYSTASRCKHS